MATFPRRFNLPEDAKPEDLEIDLDREEFHYRGQRLTEAQAERIGQEAADRLRNLTPGRKSLSGGSAHSPRVQFRVPERLNDEVQALADAKGVSVSVLAREALERFVREQQAS